MAGPASCPLPLLSAESLQPKQVQAGLSGLTLSYFNMFIVYIELCFPSVNPLYPSLYLIPISMAVLEEDIYIHS